MSKIIKYLLLLSCFTAYEVLATKNCMRGLFPTKKELSEAINFKQEQQDKRMSLAKLAINDAEHQAKLEADLGRLMDKTEEMENILQKVELPVDLSTCAEMNFLKEELSKHADNWLTMFNYCSNPDYVYNWKLFNDIIIRKSFNTSK